MTPLTIAEVRRLAARFAPPKPTPPPPPPEPVRHWLRIRAVMEEGPCTYTKIANRMGITPAHARTILKRLLKAGLIAKVSEGRPGQHGCKSVYRLTTTT